MWTRHSRVIWLCLTKQHSQTQKFLLGLFSRHSSETGGGGTRGDGQGDRIREREIRGGERGNISLAWGKIQLPERHTTLRPKKKAIYGWREGSRDLLERKVHDLFRNVLCVEFSGLSGTWSAMTWLAVSLRLRRLIGCGTFHSLTQSDLHSHWCRPIKLYMAARDGVEMCYICCNIKSWHSRSHSLAKKKKKMGLCVNIHKTVWHNLLIIFDTDWKQYKGNLWWCQQHITDKSVRGNRYTGNRW